MLELGERGPELHAGLSAAALDAGVAAVFACGPQMASLFAALPREVRGLHTADSASLAAPLREALRPGDVVLVKGSLGSRMGPIVEALAGAPPPAPPTPPPTGQG
jgi:UDP-N-acetylmuramoyl-tripeptide--D-alanyl-D-alanine ligase